MRSQILCYFEMVIGEEADKLWIDLTVARDSESSYARFKSVLYPHRVALPLANSTRQCQSV